MTDPVMLLSQVHGEGRVTFRALRAAGFYTLAGVAEASLHLLSERAHLSAQTARRLKAGAEEMLDRGLGTPVQDDPPKQGPTRARSAREPRFSSKQAGSAGSKHPTVRFSPGISIEEALLLSETWETTPTPFFTKTAEPAPAPLPASLPPIGARIPEFAAAAEVAASLVRVAPASAPDRTTVPQQALETEMPIEDRAEPDRIIRGAGETFWSFG